MLIKNEEKKIMNNREIKLLRINLINKLNCKKLKSGKKTLISLFGNKDDKISKLELSLE